MDPPDWLHVNEQCFGRKYTDSGMPGINRHVAYVKMPENTAHETDRQNTYLYN